MIGIVVESIVSRPFIWGVSVDLGPLAREVPRKLNSSV